MAFSGSYQSKENGHRGAGNSQLSSRNTSNHQGFTKNKKFEEFSENDLREANNNLNLAFQIGGYLGNGLTCPACGTNKKGKVALKVGKSGVPYWKCYKCDSRSSAINLLTKYCGYTFPDAVMTLLGREVSGKPRVKPLPPEKIATIVQSFQAEVDTEVYDFIRNSGSLEEAQRYYMEAAHIAPGAVKEAGSTYITEADKLHKELLEKFGLERLLACGVATKIESGKHAGEPWFLVNRQYPVIEVHERACSELAYDWREYVTAAKKAQQEGTERPQRPFIKPSCQRDPRDGHGHVVGMQFRPSFEHKKLVEAHKAWKKRENAYEEWQKRWSGIIDPDTGQEMSPQEAWKAMYEVAPEAAGVKPDEPGPKEPFHSSFYSLKGAGPYSLVGCGLRRISQLPPGSKVYVVEGFKDMLAARTMGVEAYAIPGTGNMPPEHSCRLLSRHMMIVTLDGDAAGEKGRQALMEHFEQNGVKAQVKPDIREGMDIADILVERHALQGCQCETCVKWRNNH